MGGDTEETNEIELPLIPEDGGMVDAARYRLGLAMLLTMLAEMADDVGPIRVEMLHDLASNIIDGNERGKRLINDHSFKMGQVKIIDPNDTQEGGDDA